jgi:hypothetical protein
MPPALSLEAIATIFGTTYPAGGTVLAASRVPRAYNYEVWRLDTRHGRYALKVARAETDPARLANALAAQRLATAAGVRGPQFLGYDEVRFSLATTNERSGQPTPRLASMSTVGWNTWPRSIG